MADLNTVKSNVAKMVSMGAPEGDIDSYIQAEGTTVDAVKNHSVNPLDYWVVNPAKNAAGKYINDAKDIVNSIPKSWNDVGNDVKAVGKSLFDHPIDNLANTIKNIPDTVMNHPLQTAAMVLPAAEGAIGIAGNAVKSVANATTNTGRYFSRVKSTFNPQAIENLNVPSVTRLNNLADKSKKLAEVDNAPLEAFNQNIERQKSKSLQEISYQTKDVSKVAQVAIQESRRVLKQNITKIKSELYSAAEKGAVEFQHKLPDFFEANGEAYGNARDAAISKMQENGKGITYQEVSNAIANAKQQSIDDLIPPDAPGFKVLNELEKKYAPQSQGVSSSILDSSGKPISQEVISNANEFVDPNQLIQDLRNVKSVLSSGASSGRTGFNQEDLVVGHLNNGIGNIIKDRVTGFSQLQSDYTPVIRAMKEAHKIFKPNQGGFNTKTAASLLKEAGIKGDAFYETGQGRVLNALEEGSKFAPGVGKLSAPIIEKGAKLSQAVSQGQKDIQALQDNLNGQLKKLEDMKRSTVGQSDAVIAKNEMAINNRKSLLNERLASLEKQKNEIIRLNANKNVADKIKKALFGKAVESIPGGKIISKF